MEERSFFYRYCIIFSNSFPKLFDFFEKALKENNFDTQYFVKGEKTFICISQTNEQRMLKEAENLKIKKPMGKELDKKNIDYENKEYFIAEKYIEYFPSKEYIEFNESIKKKTNKDPPIKKRYGLGLFTEREMLEIEKSLLENIQITNKDEFNELISTELKVLNINQNQKPLIEENSLFNTLISNKIIEDYFPLHISNFFNPQSISINFGDEINLNLIRAYYNDEILLYFSWLEHYTKYTFIPAILSAAVHFACRLYFKGKSAEFLHIIQTFGMILWIQIFIAFWHKKETEIKNKLNKNDEGYLDNDKKDLMDNYSGERSKVKGYFISIGVTLVCFCVAIYFNIVSLNIRGLIPEGKHQFLVIEKYKKEREKGYSSPWYIMLGRMFAILILDDIYDSINKILTVKENHKTKTQYYNSYIIKKFLFESFNFFFEVFYVSLVVDNPNETAKAIKYYFYTGKYLKIVYELAYPYLFSDDENKSKEEKKKSLIKEQKEEDKKNDDKKEEVKNEEEKIEDKKDELKNDENKKEEEKEEKKEGKKKDEPKEKENDEKKFLLGLKIDETEVIRQQQLSQFNPFSEYYPLIKDFCFMTLFASSAFLAPLLVHINNNIITQKSIKNFFEKRRRPEMNKLRNIYAWKYIIEGIGIISLIINILYCNTFISSFKGNNYFIIGEIIAIFIIVAFRFLFSSYNNWGKIYNKRKISVKED